LRLHLAISQGGCVWPTYKDALASVAADVLPCLLLLPLLLPLHICVAVLLGATMQLTVYNPAQSMI
jgi:hypothetical protein